MINLSSFIAFHARRTPDRCALKYRGEDISYASFDQRIRQVGGWLAAQGIGAVFLPINYRLSADEVGYIVGNSGARLLIADEEFAGIASGDAPVLLLDEAAQSSVGYLDKDGFLYLTDRKKDMIISGGENIASSEVERVIYEWPEVREVAVIGMRDERWGERPVAIVVPADGAALEISTLTGHCRAKLAGFKIPKQLIIRDSLPRNPSGKVLKRVLRAELEAIA